MYKNAWAYIGFGLFVLITAVNLVQYYEPTPALVVLLIAGGFALILEGINRRNRWLASAQESSRRFSY